MILQVSRWFDDGYVFFLGKKRNHLRRACERLVIRHNLVTTFRVFLIFPLKSRNVPAVMDPKLLTILHLAGVFALFASLGATLLGGSNQKSASILHGVSLVIILLAGFAFLETPPMDKYWWMAKLGIWLFIGVAPVLAKKKILCPCAVFALTLVGAVGAAYLGIYKPF